MQQEDRKSSIKSTHKQRMTFQASMIFYSNNETKSVQHGVEALYNLITDGSNLH